METIIFILSISLLLSNHRSLNYDRQAMQEVLKGEGTYF